MEAKEICFRVLEKFNDKDVLKEYKASLNKGQGIEGSYICLHYNILHLRILIIQNTDVYIMNILTKAQDSQ